MVEKIIKRFEDDNKMQYKNGYIYVKNFIKHQALNPKIEKGIQAELEKIPKNLFKSDKIERKKPIDRLSKALNYFNSNININSNINTNVFKEAYIKWIHYRHEIKQYLPDTTIDMQLKKLAKYPHDTAIAMLEQSMQNGWKGIFDVKQTTGFKTAGEKKEDMIKNILTEAAENDRNRTESNDNNAIRIEAD